MSGYESIHFALSSCFPPNSSRNATAQCAPEKIRSAGANRPSRRVADASSNYGDDIHAAKSDASWNCGDDTRTAKCDGSFNGGDDTRAAKSDAGAHCHAGSRRNGAQPCEREPGCSNWRRGNKPA